jgi:aminoglycoside phosphotransferase (APT) family kinase protein
MAGREHLEPRSWWGEPVTINSREIVRGMRIRPGMDGETRVRTELSGRQMVGQTLRVLRHDMDSRITPHLADPDARVAARFISDILAVLATWHLDLDDNVRSHLQTCAPLVSDAGAPARFAPGDLPMAGDEYAKVARLLQDKIEASAAFDPALATAAVGADRNLCAQEQTKIEQGVSEARDGLAAVELEVTPERARQFVDTLIGPGHEIENLARVPGGMSKESFFVDVRDHRGAAHSYVIRRDLPWGPAQTTVRDEFPALTRLFELGLPIAQPMGCDASGQCLGTPAMLSARVAGESGTDSWGSDLVASRAICRDLASVLARLHAVDPSAAGLSTASTDPREQVRAYVLEWRERWRTNRVHASPTLAAAFAWLLENIPERVDRLCIVHGDVGFHNAIIQDGRLRALLDWEFFHVGDPTEDLSYCRQFVEPLGVWEEFIETYSAASGVSYLAQNASFFELWRSVRNSITTSVAWRGFLDGAYPALKMAVQGVSLHRRIMSFAADGLLERLG